MLEVKDLSVRYGGAQVLWDVNLTVAEGEMVALMGPNGSGKSTIFKAILGLAPISGGSITFEGTDLIGTPTHKMAKAGISMVLERRRLFAKMTVRENLVMGAFTERSQQKINAALDDVLVQFPLLQEKQGDIAGTLSGGQQQIVAIARGLMSRPRLIILDEPFLGLSPIMVKTIVEAMLSINKKGVSVLFNEQNARISFANSRRGYLLQSGRIILSGSGIEMLNDPEIKRVYLGHVAA